MSSTLQPHTPTRRRGPSTVDRHGRALSNIRAFLKSRSCYDAFPVSFRLIVLDTKLSVKNALQCFLANGVVSAPLWNTEQACFAGMLTVLDLIHLIQYYYKTAANIEAAATGVEKVKLDFLREVEKFLGVDPPPMTQVHPSSSLFAAGERLITTHSRRLPLVDRDTETNQELIVSVLTQYRLLKFISNNCSEFVQQLHRPLRKLGIGTYVNGSYSTTSDTPNQNPFYPIATAKMDTKVFDVVHLFSELSISAVPIVDDEGVVINLYETVDVITLIRMGSYQSLDITIQEALQDRSPDFPGVVICTASDSLGTLLQLIRKRRVHRLVVVEGDEEEKKGGRKGRLLGVVTMSDVLRYIIQGNTSAPQSHDCTFALLAGCAIVGTDSYNASTACLTEIS
ncbi:CBS-domain-containing protein [Flagelloscypha sp. PMI_526]|nr:CBS-domain-containing protein [Flagelloscypha sp. PMI_526]